MFILLLIGLSSCNQGSGECNNCIKEYNGCINSVNSRELKCDCIRANIDCLNNVGCDDNYITLCENYGCKNCYDNNDDTVSIVIIVGSMTIIIIFSIWAIIYLRCREKGYCMKVENHNL